MTNAKGKTLLKVMGILMIIGAALGIIVAIFAIMAAMSIAGIGVAAGEAGVGIAVGTLLIVAIIITALGSILQLIAGIIGIKHCNNPAKATTCIVWGIIVLILQIISLIFTITNGEQTTFSIITSILFGLAVPVLYIVGAAMNKKGITEQ